MSAMKRVMADVAELQKPIYNETGIYYSTEDENIMKGYACIFGPKDTPYEDCPMMYNIQIGNMFPFDPPTVTFVTNDGYSRFHPNMYKEGKVCLSILGTWTGPKWSSIMRISTVLITLQSLMDNNPLRHEPNYEKGNDAVCEKYRQYVEFACIRYILSCIDSPIKLGLFKDIFLKRVPEILERLSIRLLKLIEKGETHFTSLPYNLGGHTNYAKLLEQVVKLKSAPIGCDK
jgi:ubiquitin-protein ligase